MNSSILENFILHQKDMPFFIVSKEKKFAFLNISKNAITTLKGLVLQEKGLYNLTHLTIHRMIGHYSNNYNIPINDINNYELKNNIKLIKFAVIRNPLSRFVSVYKLFWLDKFPHPYFDIVKKEFKIDSLDKFIDWVKNFELKKPIYEQDEHIRMQYTWFEKVKYLDYIVPIELLDNFIINVLKIKNFKKENISNSNINLTNKQIETINELYFNDYIFISSINEKNIYKMTE